MSRAIRIASAADGPALAALYTPYVTGSAASFETDPPDGAQMSARIVRALHTQPWLVCEIEGDVAGYAYASTFRGRPAYQWTAETTVYVSEAHQRRGVGRTLYACLLEILREQGYRCAVAAITLPNPGSESLHQALGFVGIGVLRGVGFKLGSWRDTGWWQLELAAGSPDPEPPAPFRLLPPTVTARILSEGSISAWPAPHTGC